MKYLRYPEETPQLSQRETAKTELQIFTAAFFQNHIGASCARTIMQGRTPETHGWVVGVDPHSTGPPAVVAESAVLQALSLAEKWLDEHGEKSLPSRIVEDDLTSGLSPLGLDSEQCVQVPSDLVYNLHNLNGLSCHTV